ncbi:MAG: ATP-binding cassette domain-containing protein [Clostridia bacterium]|nr:ATP-binding cassette domain-containing protein [Clostridia bacterium]
MIYQIKNGSVELGANLILRRINFEIRDNEKIAIVGRNGCGKTTLLKLISGEVDLTKIEGEDSFIAKSNKLVIGYLKQNPFNDLNLTVDEEIKKLFLPILNMRARLDYLLSEIEKGENIELLEEYTKLQEKFEDEGGYYYEKEYNMLLSGFGFSLSDKQRKLSEFSGGQLTKLGFIRLLLSKPDVLLLDEPTNHLDITTVEWLEGYLASYKKAVVIVSHDRMFIDKVANVVYEIEYGETTRYTGNYSKFVKTKEANYEQNLKAYNMQQAEIKRLQALIEKFRGTPTKVSMTDSKLKQIEHMVKISEPKKFDTKSFKASFTPNRESGKDVLGVKDLEIGYVSTLCKVNMNQTKKQRIGIIGGNGLGKSTFLKTLMGVIPKLSGDFSFGWQVDVGYFDQQMVQYASTKTVLDDFWDLFPTLSETEARGALGAFMFTRDDVFKTVDMLSGGEKVRLALCKILQKKPNFLILDEPTNHMDMIGKEALENMLSEFDGTILFVSHDRYFVKKLADALLVFGGNTATFYDYTYDEYLLKKSEGSLPLIQAVTQEAKIEPIKKGKESFLASKEKSKMERRLLKLNEKMLTLDEEISIKKNELESDDVVSDYIRLCALNEEIEALEVEQFSILEEIDEIENKLK